MTVDVDEPIKVVSYDPAWPQLFLSEAGRLRERISAPVRVIEHFGSTSVVGMSGKPIVDLLIGVDNLEQGYNAAEEIAGLGYDCSAT